MLGAVCGVLCAFLCMQGYLLSKVENGKKTYTPTQLFLRPGGCKSSKKSRGKKSVLFIISSKRYQVLTVSEQVVYVWELISLLVRYERVLHGHRPRWTGPCCVDAVLCRYGVCVLSCVVLRWVCCDVLWRGVS